MNTPYLVIVQGAPGTGKTTISHRLAADLGIDCFSKDSFKEMLYETIGIPETVDATRRFGRISIRAMYSAADEYLKDGLSVMIEAPVEAQFAMDDISLIIPLERVVQVYVSCDPEVQVRRFRERILAGNRHKGHQEAPDFNIRDAQDLQMRNGVLPGIATIMIDTTDLTDQQYHRALLQLKQKRDALQ